MPKLPSHSNPPDPRTIYWTLVAASCGALLLAGLTLNPSTAGWMSEAAQAEFASTAPAEAAAVQVAQPARTVQTVRAE
jgi:hypothetical protein